MTLVAGVDSSTQSCKVVVTDAATGRVVRTGRAAHPDGTEVDPAAWWDALRAAIADAGGLDDVEAISIGGQQHGMVVLDDDGRVIRPALLWNDTRSAGAAADLIAEVGAAEYARRTGLVPVASFTATKLRWLRDAEPANAARVAAVALPHDWLTWRLRGYGPADESELGPDLQALTTDRSDASGTGYWSPATGEYDRDLLVRALGHDATLPRVLGPADAAGTTPTGVLVGPGCGDNAGAALGLGARAGDAVVSLGTSGTVFAVTSHPVADDSGTIAGFADAGGAFLPLIATLNAARVLDSTAALLGVDHDELGRLALAAPAGADGVVLVPWFEGERTPDLPTARASVHGLSIASTSREHLARAAVEGMLCGLAEGLDAILAAGVEARRVLLVGGAAANPAVREVAATVFGVPIDVPEPGEYVALGAAVQAAWALTGERPDWTTPVAASAAAAGVTSVRERYREVAAGAARLVRP
ncbi:xylulokinase [Agromyces rhizosphaerae]|uniref:Xylulose kinase n=1 Tax=Agromyces rhizosphaerae TaxID=88374 RepID=A0A9W6CWD9_9MICO|nr:xylulokinase [Agromyces rhizosphaerae]GLI26915.1 xylulokinase [Agromyces rhizosphaerae]